MKTLFLGLVAAAALTVSAGSASAQCPSCCGDGSGGHPGFGGQGHSAFGWHPMFSKIGGGGHGMFGYGIFGSKAHALFSNHGSPFGGGANQIPVVDPRSGNAGQLVFPQNPFIRGPRDYFMFEER